jgi:hypothetical protein
MNRYRAQSGSSLITLVGVIAALAIMGAALVALTANVQGNTARDRTKTKSSSATEAALDVGLYELSANWPYAEGTGPQWDSTAQAAFRDKFSTSEFPNPKTGSFSSVSYYDNAPYTSPYSAANPPLYDANGDNRVWIVAQANVGAAKTRIQVLAEITPFNATFPHGVALFSGANLLSNGGGTNPKITVEVPPSTGTVSVRVVGNPVGNPDAIDNTSVYDQSHITGLTGTSAGSVEDVIPPSLIEGLTILAKAHGRYFDGANAIDDALDSPANGNWSDGGVTGLTVVKPTTPGTLRMPAKPDPTNTLAKPGILILLGGSNLDFQSGGSYYGVLYTQGTVDKGAGTYTVHGMLVCDSTADMRGTVNLMYNDAAIANLPTRFTSNVRMVANTWREIQPE